MFENLYKNNICLRERQEVRRKAILQQQKLKRSEELDTNRQYVKPHFVGRSEKFRYFKLPSNRLENIQLQSSEWFKEKPQNIEDWILVPCPKGKRCFVVAERGKTKLYSKKKICLMTFSSLLPGGGVTGSDNDYCILDCIFNKERSTIYVLDAVYFAISLKDCDTEFRFFWLKSKFSELNCLEDQYKCCEITQFKVLNSYDISDEEGLADVLQRYPLWLDNQPELDGFLFYHKKSHYVFGTTPLVCWLFPFMLPDVLQMTVSGSYEAPPNYSHTNPWKYMDEFDKEMITKRRKNVTKELVLKTADMEDKEISLNDCMHHINFENSMFSTQHIEVEEIF